VVTQGATGLDFTDVGTGSCDTNGTGHTYAIGATCTVNVTFKPIAPGLRLGAVQLLNASAAPIATAHIYGTGQGPAVGFLPATQTTLGNGLLHPWGVAVDAAGNVYATSYNGVTTQIFRIAPNGVETPVGAPGSTLGLTVDGAGNVIYADYTDGIVVMVPPGCVSSSCQSTVASGLNGTDNVAVDGAGDVFITEYLGNKVIEVTPSGVQTTVPASGLSGPMALAVDSAGDLFIADNGNNRIVEVTPGGVQSTVPASGLSGPAGIAVDPAGDVFIDDVGNLRLVEVTPSGVQTTLPVTGGLNNPVGVAADGMGNVYIANRYDDEIVKFSRSSTSLSFATTSVGSQSSDSLQTVMLENIGNQPLTFSVPATGENPSVAAGFTLDSSTTCPEVLTSSPAGSLASGATCDLSVDFIPTTAGSNSGAVTLTENNLNVANSMQSIALSGTGLQVSPTVSVTSSPNPSTFGQSVTFTTTISGGYSPSGQVTISYNGATVCSASVNPATRTAQCASSGSALPVGNDAIVATYTGDTNNVGSAGSLSGGQQVQQATVDVIFATSPSGLSYSVNGTTYTGGQLLILTVGTPYTLSTTSPQSGAPGVEYVFSTWTDGSPSPTNTYTPTANSNGDIINALFATLTEVTATVEMGGQVDATGGTATVPAGYYGLGTQLNISATPNPGYYFAGWSGAANPSDVAAPGSANTTVTMFGVENLVADFELIPSYQGVNLTDDAPGNAANCPGPACTLRDAILAAEANNGGAGNITFAPGSTGTITLTAPLPALTGQITITGSGANLLKVSGNNSTAVGSIFQVSSGATVGLSGLTIENGSDNGTGGAGILNNGGTLTVSNCELLNNTANGSNGGGGILNNGGTLTVTGSTFWNNSASSGNGGAINNNGGTLAVSYSTFIANHASGNGGAIQVSGTSPDTLTNGTFYGNSAGESGGAIEGNSTLLTVASSIFESNSATNGSGLLADAGAISASNNLFYLNVDKGSQLEDDCGNCSLNANPISGDPNLGLLGPHGGSTPTMPPAPPSAAICAGPAMAAATDQRGFPNSTIYNGTACYDLGAVQTNYALNFTTEPPSTGTVAGVAMSPAPAVTVTESNALFPKTGSVSATDSASDLTTTPATATTTADVASFGSLIFTSVTSADTLTATLVLNPNNSVFNLTTQSTSFSVGAATPVVTWPTASAITYGQPLSSSTLTGGSASSNSVPVPGSFAFSSATTIPGAGTQSESVTFTPTDLTNYTPVTSTVSVLVNQATPTVTWPTASAINYGQALSSSTLSGGSAVSSVTSAAVGGGFAFASPTTVPQAGGQSESLTFTPTDSIDYDSATSTVSVQVNKVNSPVTTWPTASAITYGQPLSASALSGGVATIAGSFAFTSPATVAGAGMQSESVTFTPTNLTDYSPVSSSVIVLVNKATPTVTWPTASAISAGQTLASSTLSGGSAKSPITSAVVAGSFAFTTPTTAPTATGSQNVNFTPADPVDYNSVIGSVTVTVTVVSAPVASITPTSINFGTLYLGSIVTQTVTVKNTGTAALTINDPLIAIVQGGNSNEFITVNLCPKSLAAGKSCLMTVTFIASPFYTPQTATLKITDNAAGSPQAVMLTATVINPIPAFSAASLSFGTVKTNSGTASKSITLTSIGGTPLSIGTIAVSGAGFSKTADTCSGASLNPKATCTITVTYKPTAKGSVTGTLVIPDNALINSQAILLSGTGN
jgi:hypothetical protein